MECLLLIFIYINSKFVVVYKDVVGEDLKKKGKKQNKTNKQSKNNKIKNKKNRIKHSFLTVAIMAFICKILIT